MVATQQRREIAQWTDKQGHTFIATFNPDDMEGSVRRLVSLAERNEMTWPVVAALRVAMINAKYPGTLKVSKQHSKRLG